MGVVTDQDVDLAGEVSQLRAQRAALEQLTRDLMEWIGLLRHKAMSLRALTGRSTQGRRPGRSSGGLPTGLTPGSLDPRALAEELAASLSQAKSRSTARAQRHLVALGAEQAIERARVLWDTVADPRDAVACERLAEAADRLAAQLEVQVNEALDQYRKLGDDLVRALERQRRRGAGSAAKDDQESESRNTESEGIDMGDAPDA